MLASAASLRQHPPVKRITARSHRSIAAALTALLTAATPPALGRAAESVDAVEIPEAGTDLQAPNARDEAAKTAIGEVTAELRRIADEHGPDSVALQAKFLLRSTAAGALGPTEVKVAGPSKRLGADYLEIVVDTGLFFEEGTSTPADRADLVWRMLAGPALEDMTSFQLKPTGLEVVFLYKVQNLSDSVTGKLDPSLPGRAETLAIALDHTLLESVARDEVAGDALRRAVRFDASFPGD